MRNLYNIIEGILSSDVDIKARGEYDVFLVDIVHELKLCFDIDRTSYSNPFATIHNFEGFQYKKALDKFNDHLEAVKFELKRKGIKTEVEVYTKDSIFGRSVSTSKTYKLTFSKLHHRDLKLDIEIFLIFAGEYKLNEMILKLIDIKMSSSNTEIKDMFK